MFVNLKQFNEVLDINHSMDAIIKSYDNEMHIIFKCVISKITLIEVFYKMGHYRMRIKISTCYISWMVQAVDLIDCDHGDDLNEHMDAC